MKDFIYYAPTQVVFGALSEDKTGKLVKQYGGAKVLVHYGGQSAERSGLLDKICRALEAEGIAYVKLGGVVPNPRLSKVHEGIELCRKEKVDFILAVGGGSVIDSAKAIAFGVPYEGEVWDFYMGRAHAEACLPVATVLTIPAAGSEMSNSTVITNEDGDLKKGYSNNLCRCKFAVMNPERTYTLPNYQTACGVTDIMMHTMERYFSHDDDMTVTDAIAESILRTVKDSVFEGKNVTMGYARKREDLLLGDERNGFMRTGDLAYRDEDGCYYIVGRMGRFLKLYGMRIGLDECEQIIKGKCPIECACVGTDEKMIVYLTDDKYVTAVKEILVEKTKLVASAFEVRIIDSIPKNEAGKILYSKLNL